MNLDEFRLYLFFMIQVLQKGAAKLSEIEEARTVVDQCSSGLLSTFSQVNV